MSENLLSSSKNIIHNIMTLLMWVVCVVALLFASDEMYSIGLIYGNF